jgi:hypothetical protein
VSLMMVFLQEKTRRWGRQRRVRLVVASEDYAPAWVGSGVKSS